MLKINRSRAIEMMPRLSISNVTKGTKIKIDEIICSEGRDGRPHDYIGGHLEDGRRVRLSLRLFFRSLDGESLTKLYQEGEELHLPSSFAITGVEPEQGPYKLVDHCLFLRFLDGDRSYEELREGGVKEGAKRLNKLTFTI